MLRIYTTPTGRQTLLSNLEIRNVLYNKYLTIAVEGEDEYDKDGKLKPAEMKIYLPNQNQPLVWYDVDDYDFALCIIKRVIREHLDETHQ